MKRSIQIIAVLVIFSIYVSGQNIPNRGFEEWEVRNLYERPVSWYTSNSTVFSAGEYMTNVTKTEDSFSGNYALNLETVVFGEDTLLAYAVAGGMIVGGEGVRDIDYIGGFAFSEKPDSLIGYFKYNIQENDTAFIIVTFRKNGIILAENYFLLFGIQENYTEIGFELDTLLETPDSAFFAISSTHPDSPVAGSWVIADSLHFSNTTANIPNGSFESWEMLSYEDPIGWESVNRFSVITDSELSAIKTDEAYSGDYALMMTTIHLNMLEQNVGIITPGDLFIGGFSGGFPYDEVPTSLSGYYRFLPVGSDSAQVLMAFSKYDTVSGESEIVADYSFKLPARPTYTYFEEELSLGDIEI
ncbi:MAG: PCMD domain-containing protein, partial [Bacteroidales bacterium]